MYSNLDYLAGLFDGEGSFSIQVQPRRSLKRGSVVISPKISMTLKYGKFVLQDFVEVFGGKVYAYADGMDRWSIQDAKRVRLAAETLSPRLFIKRTISKDFIAALDLIAQPRCLENDIAITEIAYSLNPTRKSTRPVEYIIKEIGYIYG